MYRNFYSYNDMPKPPELHREEKKESPPLPSKIHKEKDNNKPFSILENGKILGKFELDDVILIVVALLLFADDCDDTLLLLAIGFVFLSGIL